MDSNTLPLFSQINLKRKAHLRNSKQLINIRNCFHLLIWRGKLLFRFNEGKPIPHLLEKKTKFINKLSNYIFLGEFESKNIILWDMSDSREVLGSTEKIGSFSDGEKNYHPDLPKDTYFCDLRNLLPLLNAKYANLCATAKGIFEWHKRVNFCQSCGGKLSSEMSGWEKACEKCKFKAFPRIDPVVIMLITKGNDILLGRSHGWPEKMYSCLAGFIEPGETIEAAAEREAMEESGIKIKNVKYITSQPWPFPASLMMGCTGEAQNRTIQIDRDELEDAIWVSKEDAFQALNGLDKSIFMARRGAIARYLIEKWIAGLI
ncbi:NAD(+) diphosphatase [Paracoccaceae bacterium]|nr:NAD(+) diphosphatase [Paracoccaceae bacterium]